MTAASSSSSGRSPASAGDATINNGGLVLFMGTGTGGNATVTNTSASAAVDFSGGPIWLR
jgi:hypothetical protein